MPSTAILKYIKTVNSKTMKKVFNLQFNNLMAVKKLQDNRITLNIKV